MKKEYILKPFSKERQNKLKELDNKKRQEMEIKLKRTFTDEQWLQFKILLKGRGMKY